VSTVLPAAVLGARALVLQDPNPSPSYPVEPRTLAGADPFALVPKPQECARSRDRAGRADYFPLSRPRPSRRASNPFAPGAPATTALTLENAKGQRFVIYVSAGSAATVSRYIEQAWVCVEAITLKAADPRVLVPVRISAHLVAAAVAQTGRSATALSALRNSLAASGPASLADVITAAGGVVDDVVVAASDATKSELAARIAAGELTPAEVTSLDVPALVNDLASQAGAPFLTPPADDPSTAAQRARLLGRNRGTVLVGIVPAGTGKPLPKRYIAWAAFEFAPLSRGQRFIAAVTTHGGMHAGDYHNYIAKCQKSASAQIFAGRGGATVKLWRVTDWAGYATSYAGSGASSKLYAWWGSARTYDSWVRAIYTDTTYSMYYSWIKGSGGGC
jgi:hypothetical protein